MAKLKFEYICNSCDYTSRKIFGICPECNSGLGEKRAIKEDKIIIKGKEVSLNDFENLGTKYDILSVDINNFKRIDTGFDFLNNVFGGVDNNKGITPSSLNVFWGRPGIGKSTLLLQIIDKLSSHLNCFYLTAEESKEQVKDRHNRLGLKNNFEISETHNTLEIKDLTKDSDFIIIDSINTLYLPDSGVIGGVSQINANVMFLMDYAKEQKKTIILVGHATKDGDIAGSNFFKHMVDGVFQFIDMEEDGIFRSVESSKNRFGKTDESAIFEMTEKGLVEVSDPSFIFIEDNKDTFGSATSMIIKGNRPIFIDAESLVTSSNTEKKFYNSVGFDSRKFMQILAIISKYLKAPVYQKNVFTNISGGLKISNEPQVDLAIIASIMSSHKEININDYIFIGEVSLNGSIKKHRMEKKFIEHCKKMKINKKIISNSTGYSHIQDILSIFK